MSYPSYDFTFAEYQRAALGSAVYPQIFASLFGKTVPPIEKIDAVRLDFIYPALKLAGEAGEVAEKVGKIIRDKGGVIFEADRQALKKELGDVLWYIAALARELDFSLEDVAQANLDKLAGRVQRGTLQGSGDDR